MGMVVDFPPKRGRPARFTKDHQLTAHKEYLAGDSCEQIAKRLGCTPRTVRRWVKDYGWDGELTKRRKTITGLESEIHHLSQKKNLSPGDAQNLAMLTKSLERLNRSMPKPKPKPVIHNALHKDLLKQVLHPDYGLYPYQVAELQDNSRFSETLKSRQIGYSYIVGLRVVLGAAQDREQNVLAASQDQSDIVKGFAEHHAARLGVPLKSEKKALKLNNIHLRFLPANFRTAQGYPGDLYLDEFAWQQNQRRIWAAAMPSITAVGGMVRVFSTPFLPGSLFWEIATNYNNEWSMWTRRTITIHDAIAQGMPLPGGLEELRPNFDAETWAMMYECKWAEDGSALLSWKLLEKLPKCEPSRLTQKPLYCGLDVGRINDRSAFSAYYWANKVGRWRLAFWEEKKAMGFAQQEAWIDDLYQRYNIARLKIDRTGLGMQLAEQIQEKHPQTAEGVWFTSERKAKLAQNYTRLAEEHKIEIHNDQDLFARLHAVKRAVSGDKLKYDAARDQTGHGDTFWSHALALDDLTHGPGSGGGWKVILI